MSYTVIHKYCIAVRESSSIRLLINLHNPHDNSRLWPIKYGSWKIAWLISSPVPTLFKVFGATLAWWRIAYGTLVVLITFPLEFGDKAPCLAYQFSPAEAEFYLPIAIRHSPVRLLVNHHCGWDVVPLSCAGPLTTTSLSQLAFWRPTFFRMVADVKSALLNGNNLWSGELLELRFLQQLQVKRAGEPDVTNRLNQLAVLYSHTMSNIG